MKPGQSAMDARYWLTAKGWAATKPVRRPHGDPTPVGDVAMDVLAELLEREGRSAVSPVTEGESGPIRGTIGAQVKTAPAARQRCDSGASPTVKESTE